MDMYASMENLVTAAEQAGCAVSQVVLRQQAEELQQSEDELLSQMAAQYDVMHHAVQEGVQPGVRSTSGLTGGDGYRLWQARAEGAAFLCGDLVGGAMMRAMAVSEVNASMGRIVAAPTAGSCGIVPGAVITMELEKGCSREQCIQSLFTASAVGMVIANNACLAGAQGGCQAECGSAAAMAAAALVEMAGGTPRMVAQAVAITIKSILGLVCDPVAGLVEIPCIKRNASGVAGAFSAATLALAGVESHIPADEVILAMKRVGDSMSTALKETAEGGLAATPTAQRLFEQVFGDKAAACNNCGACRQG